MSLLHRFVSPRFLIPVVMLCLAAPLAAQPRPLDERAEVVRQLNESRERVRKLEERLRQLDARRAPRPTPALQSAAAQPVAANCDVPFFIDQDGVKHFKLECLASEPHSACETNAFAFDDDGIKHMRPGCGDESLIQNQDSR